METQATEQLHEATLTILEEVGVRLEHDDIVELLRKAGARPGTGAQEVRFPREMVREYLAQAPPTVELAARDGSSVALTPEFTPASGRIRECTCGRAKYGVRLPRRTWPQWPGCAITCLTCRG